MTVTLVFQTQKIEVELPGIPRNGDFVRSPLFRRDLVVRSITWTANGIEIGLDKHFGGHEWVGSLPNDSDAYSYVCKLCGWSVLSMNPIGSDSSFHTDCDESIAADVHES